MIRVKHQRRMLARPLETEEDPAVTVAFRVGHSKAERSGQPLAMERTVHPLRHERAVGAAREPKAPSSAPWRRWT